MPRAGSTLETSGDTCGADAVRCIKAPGRTATARSCGCATERPRHAQRTARALRQRPGGPASLVGCDQRGGAPALSCRRDGALAAHGAAALGWEEASRLRHETLGWTAIKEGLLGGTFSVSPRSELKEARLHVAGASTRTPAFAPRSESGRAERATCSARKAERHAPLSPHCGQPMVRSWRACCGRRGGAGRGVSSWRVCGRRACRTSCGPRGDAGNNPCSRQGDRVVAPADACSSSRLSLKGVGCPRRGRRGGCAAVTVLVVGSAVTVWGPGSGPHDGELVAVNLGQVVGHHQ